MNDKFMLFVCFFYLLSYSNVNIININISSISNDCEQKKRIGKGLSAYAICIHYKDRNNYRNIHIGNQHKK